MTITQTLREDHRAALEAMQWLRGQRLEPNRYGEAPSRLCELLRAHLKAEEEVLLPAVRNESNRLSFQRLLDADRELRTILGEWEHAAAAPSSGVLQRMEDALAEHTRRMEETLYPEAERVVSEARLEAMWYEAERLKTGQSRTDSLIFPAHRFGR
jgi:hemerythrin-like domain-containing protein